VPIKVSLHSITEAAWGVPFSRVLSCEHLVTAGTRVCVITMTTLQLDKLYAHFIKHVANLNVPSQVFLSPKGRSTFPTRLFDTISKVSA
jgi:hypothetical protein